MIAHTDGGTGASDALRQELRAALEATRGAFRTIVAGLTAADGHQPSANPAWTIDEVLWHIAVYLFLIPDQLDMLRSGTFPDLTDLAADTLNRRHIEDVREGAQAVRFNSIASTYDAGHALTLAALDSVRPDEWTHGMRMPDMGATFGGEYRTIEGLFRYHGRHFAEHAAQIPASVASGDRS